MIEPKILPGFIEFSPIEQVQFKKIKTIIAKNFELFGYNPLDTVVIEKESVLLAKAGGETEKQIFSLKKGDTNMCLRFDLTVPLARYVASRENELAFPFKRFQIGKVYRGERPQKGRFREFYQCDIDVIGKDKLALNYDAEVPAVMCKIFREIGIKNFKVKINNRKILLGFINSLEINYEYDEIVRLIDKFDKIGEEKFVLTLKDWGVEDDKIGRLLEFIKMSGTNDEKINFLKNLNIQNENFELGIEEIEKVLNAINLFGEGNNIEIDFKISRGLDYYTGTVYETFIVGHEDFGSIASGGRYDNLAGHYTNSKLPGVGMAIGLSRLFMLLKDNNLLDVEERAVADILVLPMGDFNGKAIEISQELRNAGIKCEIYFEEAKFKSKMNFANKIKVPYVLILGEDEVQSGLLTLKNMSTGEQQRLSACEIAGAIKGEQR